MAWQRFQPTTTESRSNPLTNWAIRPWVQLVVRYLSIYLSIYIYIYIYMYYICICIYVSIYLSIYLSIYEHNVCSVISVRFQGSSRRVSSFEDFSALLSSWEVNFNKSQVLLIANILLVVKAENIYWNKIKMHKKMQTELSH